MIEMEAYPVLRDLTDEEILTINQITGWDMRERRTKERLIYLLKRYRWDKIYEQKKQQEIIDLIS